MTNASDAKQFSCWLNNSKSDSEKHQRLTCLYTMLRYIQQVGYTEAFNKIIILVSKDHIKLFEQLMDNYNDISLPTRKLTLLGNQIHPYLNELYINGNLDSDVINILVRRQLLHLWKGDNLIHLRLLLPMCNILLKWDHSVSNATNQPSTVTFNRQIYNPLELVESEDMPLLAQLADLDESKRKGLVLGCVDFALRPKRPLNWHGIHKDYKLWLSLLKLWWHTKTEHSNSMKMTLVALIISFLKHALLDTYGETKGKIS